MRDPVTVCEADGHQLEVEVDFDGEPVAIACTRVGGCGRLWDVL